MIKKIHNIHNHKIRTKEGFVIRPNETVYIEDNEVIRQKDIEDEIKAIKETTEEIKSFEEANEARDLATRELLQKQLPQDVVDYFTANKSLFKGDKGDKGDTGATGAKGATGATGAKGNTGTSMRLRDAWAANVDYVGGSGAAYLDIVTYGGSTYACAKAHKSSSSITPANTTYWTKIASKGDTGDKGAKGDTGAKGATGDKGAKGDTGAKGATGATGPGATVARALGTGVNTNGVSITYANGSVMVLGFVSVGTVKAGGEGNAIATFNKSISANSSVYVPIISISSSDNSGIEYAVIAKTSTSITIHYYNRNSKNAVNNLVFNYMVFSY